MVKTIEDLLTYSYDKIDCLTFFEALECIEILGFCQESGKYEDLISCKQKIKLEVTKRRKRNTVEDIAAELSYIKEENRSKCLRLQSLVNKVKSLTEELMELRDTPAYTRMSIFAKEHPQKDPLIAFMERDKTKFQSDFRKINKWLGDNQPSLILITGEVSAGKSSFINLLVGEQLMPVDFGPCTSTFCEITYGEFKNATVHSYSGVKREIKYIDNQQFAQELADVLGQKIESGRSVYKKVELQLPCKFLESGICIVDSPGFGENDEFNLLLRKQMARCFAIVCILKHFSETAEWFKTILLPGFIDTDKPVYKIETSSTLFVVNKWDKVTAEKDNVIACIKNKLKDFANDQQILTLSVKHAAYMQEEEVMAEDLAVFHDSLNFLLVRSLQTKISRCFGLTYLILEKTLNAIISFINKANMNKEDRKVEIYKIEQNLKQYRLELDQFKKQELEKLKSYIGNAVKELCQQINHQDFKDRFTSSMLKEIAPAANTINQVDRQLEERAAVLIKKQLKDKEVDTSFFQKTREGILSSFELTFSKFEAKSHTITSNISDISLDQIDPDKLRITRLLPKWDQMSTGKRILFGMTLPVLAPVYLAAAMVMLPVVLKYTVEDMVKNRLFNTSHMKQYYKCKEDHIFKKSLDIIRMYSTLPQTELKMYAAKELQICEDTLYELYYNATLDIDDKRKHISYLKVDTGIDSHLVAVYQPHQEKMQNLLTEIDKFRFYYLLEGNDIWDKYVYDESPVNVTKLCAGYNWMLAPVRLQPLAQKTLQLVGNFVSRKNYVCCKMCGNSTINAIDIQMLLQEVNFARNLKLSHVNILTLYCMAKSSLDASKLGKVTLIYEPYQMNLRNYLDLERAKSVNQPIWNCEHRFMFLNRIFIQIARAIAYLHLNEYTAHGLTLDSIAMADASSNFSIPKLTCVYKPGYVNFKRYLKHINQHSKPGDNPIEKAVEPFRYLSPEVLQPPYKFTAPCDLYSLAIAMYEAWTDLPAYLQIMHDRDHALDNLKKFAAYISVSSEENRPDTSLLTSEDTSMYTLIWLSKIKLFWLDYNNKKVFSEFQEGRAFWSYEQVTALTASLRNGIPGNQAASL